MKNLDVGKFGINAFQSEGNKGYHKNNCKCVKGIHGYLDWSLAIVH